MIVTLNPILFILGLVGFYGAVIGGFCWMIAHEITHG